MRKNIAVLLFLSISLVACLDIPITQQEVSIPHEQWESSLSPAFDFEVSDTTAYYNVFLYLRHRNAYAYNNIWLRLYATLGRDTLDVKKEFVLASAHEWLGKTITGDIVEQFIPITRTPIRITGRNVHVQLEHIMRDDPLANIINVGIRIQKVNVAR